MLVYIWNNIIRALLKYCIQNFKGSQVLNIALLNSLLIIIDILLWVKLYYKTNQNIAPIKSQLPN